MKLTYKISFHIVLAIAITGISYLLKSGFVSTFLQTNLIVLLATLLAINTATTGLIASKMQDLLQHYTKVDFSSSVLEMKLSLKEQIVLIFSSGFVQILLSSELLDNVVFYHICLTLLTAIFTYSISILWDTGKSVFVIIELINQYTKPKQ